MNRAVQPQKMARSLKFRITVVEGFRDDDFTLDFNVYIGGPVAEWVRSLNFSALNHSIISPL